MLIERNTKQKQKSPEGDIHKSDFPKIFYYSQNDESGEN